MKNCSPGQFDNISVKTSVQSIFFLCVAAGLFVLLATLSIHAPVSDLPNARLPKRILSFAPAITETLYALGLGDKICGVTQYCAWPPEVSTKPVVAGFRTINLEASIKTKPDLALLPVDMAYYKSQLENLGIPVLLFNYRDLSTYLDDVLVLGNLTGKGESARMLVSAFKKAQKKETINDPVKVIFLTLNPDAYYAPIREASIIGKDGFYDELIKMAGGVNAYEGPVAFPVISLEALISMKPRLLVVSAPNIDDEADLEKNLAEMLMGLGLSGTRILILKDPGDTIPGPRSLHTLQKIRNALDNLAGKETD